MKTMKEWFALLPEEYERRAIYNAVKQDALIYDKCITFEDAVREGFSWHDTTEGREFWDEVSRWTPEPKLPIIKNNNSRASYTTINYER